MSLGEFYQDVEKTKPSVITEIANKNWVGNKNSIYKTLGASNHTVEDREQHDYYATHPEAVEWLIKLEEFNRQEGVWECACGEGHISKVLEQEGYPVHSTDLVDRGFGVEGVDFLSYTEAWSGDIVTNPPYKYAQSFVEKALSLVDEGSKVALFLKLQFLEGKARKKMFAKYPPVRVWVSSSRLLCAKNGDFDLSGGSAVAYAWFVWEKGFKGHPEIRWFN